MSAKTTLQMSAPPDREQTPCSVQHPLARIRMATKPMQNERNVTEAMNVSVSGIAVAAGVHWAKVIDVSPAQTPSPSQDSS
mmetsp:Transcript_89431/g.255386  ORF Transcript_89431/g.255386 Transcript_89431/m.255386 type:complete len:81 (-) Transcript_89431:720-962(-)